jgi:phi13 family phage major tail protein
MADTNKIHYGLENVHYAVLDGDTYSTPIALPYAVSISLKPQGSQVDAYGDNILAVSFTQNNGYTGSLEMLQIPDTFRTDCLGEVVDKNGVVTETNENFGKEFALMFEFKGDSVKRRHVLLRCAAARPQIESSTVADKTTLKNETIDLTVMPVAIGALKGKIKSSVDNTEAESAVYNTFFDKVYDGTAPTVPSGT